MGDKLHSQSWVFDMFIISIVDQELPTLKSLELEFSTKNMIESFLMCSLTFLISEAFLMPRHLHNIF